MIGHELNYKTLVDIIIWKFLCCFSVNLHESVYSPFMQNKFRFMWPPAARQLPHCQHTQTHAHTVLIKVIRCMRSRLCSGPSACGFQGVPGRPVGCGADHNSYLITVKGALTQRFCPGHIWRPQQ